MEIKNAQITILANQDAVEIEIRDADACITFARVRLTPEQFCKCLSRLAHVECKASVSDLDLVGKKHENKKLTFPMPLCTEWKNRKTVAYYEAVRVCPEGWEPDDFFGSQDSFFQKDGEQWASVTIRRWI
jgi:hypothetical protein